MKYLKSADAERQANTSMLFSEAKLQEKQYLVQRRSEGTSCGV